MTMPSILSVNAKPTPGPGKLPQPEVTLVVNHGVEGDFHGGATVRHRSAMRKDPTRPNLRQVHLIQSELFDEMAALGITVTPGAMGENITTRGIDLLALAPGTRLRLGETAVIELTGYRVPCNQLDGVDERLLGEVAAKDGDVTCKAGVMSIVLEPGKVRPNDEIRVVAPAGAAAEARLRPV